MSALASGVVIVTSWIDGRPWGLTVSAFASVSAEPPTVLVSLQSDTTSSRAIEQDGGFGISILGRHHRAAARHGSAAAAPKFLEPFADRRRDAVNPSVAGALAHLDCQVTDELAVADHTIFVARVGDVRIGSGEPLVYFRRSYRTLNPFTGRRTACHSS